MKNEALYHRAEERFVRSMEGLRSTEITVCFSSSNDNSRLRYLETGWIARVNLNHVCNEEQHPHIRNRCSELR